MTGQLVIKTQRYPTHTGALPLTYGIFLETREVIEGLEFWQLDCSEVFVGYSRTKEGAERAVKELSRYANAR